METHNDYIFRNHPEYKLLTEHIKQIEAENKRYKKQIAKLKREIEYNILCRLGDTKYTKRGKKLMKEFDKVYSLII